MSKKFVERSQASEQHESKSWIKNRSHFCQQCLLTTLLVPRTLELLIRSCKRAGRASVHVADVDIKNVSARKTSAVHLRAPSVESEWYTLLVPIWAWGKNQCYANWSPKRTPNFAEDSTLIARIQNESAWTEDPKAHFGVRTISLKKTGSSIFCGKACNISWILLWFHCSAACFQK